ncbi:hypothetical protein MASR2M8_07930 [Opitutaceae bacterium]
MVAFVLLGAGKGMEERARNDAATTASAWLGVRAVAADFAWIGVQAAWEQQDSVATTAAIRRTVTWDPNCSLFWINGARMIAYDFAAWRIAEAGGPGIVPGLLEQRWRNEQALQALAHLDAALTAHPDEVNFLIEQGNIELWARGNLAGAAAAFGQAANMAGAPDYALRLEVGLLRRLGRSPEALRRLETYRSKFDANSSNSPLGRWIDDMLVLLRWELEMIN